MAIHFWQSDSSYWSVLCSGLSFSIFLFHLEVKYIADRFESNYLILEKIKLVTIQFINDSVGMSIATSAIAFYIPVGIMCILYSQVSVLEILISLNWLWTWYVYSCVDIPTYFMNLSFIFQLRYIWLWKNEPKFYNLWMVSKKSLNKIFYQHNVIGKNRQKLPDHKSHQSRQFMWADVGKN